MKKLHERRRQHDQTCLFAALCGNYKKNHIEILNVNETAGRGAESKICCDILIFNANQRVRRSACEQRRVIKKICFSECSP